MRISFTTFIGLIMGFGIIIWGIMTSTDKMSIFFSVSSVFIVLGGTIASSVIGQSGKLVISSLFSIGGMLFYQPANQKIISKDIGVILEWSKKIQQSGSQAYDAISKDYKGGFIEYLFTLVSTGYSIDEINNFAETFIEEKFITVNSKAQILGRMAAAAPAFGMVGTLIGLIVMLGQLEDPSKMGPGLSVALMTTLYGVIFARLLFDPAAAKMKRISNAERFKAYFFLEGITLILERKSPFFIQDRLNSYLEIKNQYNPEKRSK